MMTERLADLHVAQLHGVVQNNGSRPFSTRSLNVYGAETRSSTRLEGVDTDSKGSVSRTR
jgi:hypothetical protein